jgi:threonyl-tRNA synthetase
MFPPMKLDDAEYRLKPMNCPGHILIYKNSPKSYRDLPQRYAEFGTVYRNERSGTMHGLLRVRGFTQDDAHIFCTPGQIEGEVIACLDFAEAVLKTFGFKEYRVELSTRDPNKGGDFFGTADDWSNAEGALKKVLTDRGLTFKTFPGEAAFYGPKIDVKLIDSSVPLKGFSASSSSTTQEPSRYGSRPCRSASSPSARSTRPTQPNSKPS